MKIMEWLEDQDVRVVITTLGRPEKLPTLEYLLEAKITPELIVQRHESHLYHAVWQGVKITVLPRGVDKLHTTRQWLLDNTKQRYLIILDDDLRFATLIDDEGHYTMSTRRQRRDMFRGLVRALKKRAHASIASRQGAGFQREPYNESTRMQRVLAYDLVKVRKTGARFDRVNPLSDFDMTLQLLRAGLPNRVLYAWVQDEVSGFGAPGGCSIWRTPKRLRIAQKWLRKTWGRDIVNLSKRQYKDGETRLEVRIAWKKAVQAIDLGRDISKIMLTKGDR